MKALILVLVAAAITATGVQAQSLDGAQRLFYNGRYEASAAEALGVRTADVESLAASELRSSALLFQLKRVFGEFSNKDSSTDKAWKQCAACPAIMSSFLAETAQKSRQHISDRSPAKVRIRCEMGWPCAAPCIGCSIVA